MLRAAIFVVALAAVSSGVPVSRPASGKYFFEGMFSIPEYGIFAPLTVHTDETADMQRIVYYGRDTYLTRGDLGEAYEVVPRINEFVCFSTNVSGPTSNDVAPVPLTTFVPDVSTWNKSHDKIVRGIPCHTFTLETTNFTYTSKYDFAVSIALGQPVQLREYGFNFVHSSHPDEYILDYNIFIPAVDPAVFNVPELCEKKDSNMARPTPERVAAHMRAMAQRLSRVAPSHHGCDVSEEFKSFLNMHGKRYRSCEESARREANFKKNMQRVEAHNARNDVTHSLRLNHFADMDDEEFKNLMLLQRGRAHDNRATRRHVANPNDPLPKSIDWREKGAVNRAKDQGVCGSCYVFGSVASLEGVYAVKYGKLLDISEQNMMDCSWGYEWSGPGGNLGCDGGYSSGVYQWMMDAGGIALEIAQPYQMEDGFCRVDHSSGVKLTGYVNVSSIEDLKHAIATVGPVAIAIDASHPSFRFYNGGIYYEPECKSDIDSLDHEIVAVGWGVDETTNTEYWIVKNSWSDKHWGENGFAKMSMKDNNCGVATQANYPIVA